MKTIVTALTTEAVFSDDGLKRYLLRKVWDEQKPKLAVIMLAPSSASGVELDNSTQFVLNNAYRLGYGSVDVLNLFATLNDFSLQYAEEEDGDNTKAILKSAKDADTIVYAAGVGKAKNKMFQLRQKIIIGELKKYEDKLHCLCTENGEARFQHPLSPAVRTWFLSTFKTTEIIDNSIIDDIKKNKK